MNAASIQAETWEMSCAKADARRYCDRFEISDYDTYLSLLRSIAHRRFMEASKPLREMRARIFHMHAAIHPARILTHKDGRVEHVPEPLSAMQTEGLRRLDAAIADEAKKWGFKTVELKSDSKVSETDSNAMQIIALEPM